jgi:hypothetical protein
MPEKWEEMKKARSVQRDLGKLLAAKDDDVGFFDTFRRRFRTVLIFSLF